MSTHHPLAVQPGGVARKDRAPELTPLNRRQFIQGTAVASAAALLAGKAEAAGAAPARPLNVLLIGADDLNCSLGCYGHPIVRTPHLDALAGRSVRFDRAYCQFPLCTPSRSSMLTGARPNEVGVLDLGTHFRSKMPDAVTLPHLFRQHGYRVARAGKVFHQSYPEKTGEPGLDDPAAWERVADPRGWDCENLGLVTNYTPERAIGTALANLAADAPDEAHTDALTASAVIGMMEEFRDRPFFLAAGFTRPHAPFIAPRKYFDLYPLEEIPPPPEHTEDLRDVPEIAQWTKPPHWGLGAEAQRQAIRGYYASVSFLDAQVGRLIGALDQLGLAENTIVVLWSDHGFLLGEHGQWLKQSLFEQSARVPLIIAAPGFGRGAACHRVVESLDIYPTVAALAGLPVGPAVTGRSLVPLLRDPFAAWPHAAFTQVARRDAFGGASLRTERWRYSEWGSHGDQGVELYDHSADPLEYRNLADDPAWATVRRKLSAQLRAKVPLAKALPGAALGGAKAAR